MYFIKWAKSQVKQTELPIKHTITGGQVNSGNHADHVTFGMHDQFVKPQSNGATLLKKSLPYNTVSMHTVLFRSENVKQSRLEKQNFKKENGKCTKMFRAVGVGWACPGCNQMTFPATRCAAWIKLWIYFTSVLSRSRVQPSVPGEERRLNSRERRKSSPEGSPLVMLF